VTNTNVIKLAQPGTFTDSLTEILRNGARALLTQAVETEVADFLGRYANLKTEAGRRQEGTRRACRRHPRERAILEGAAARSQAARSDDRPTARHCRRGARLLEGPKTRAQRCWVHKTANVLNRLPKSLQAKAKRALQDIWMAETRKAAEAALDGFIETYGIKYEKAVECLTKDREALLAFYDFPAEHWKHLRTTNPIESTFATVRHRTVRSRGCLSNKTALAMIFKLTQAAEKRWHRLRGHHQLPKVILGVKFNDGIEIVRSQAQAAAA